MVRRTNQLLLQRARADVEGCDHHPRPCVSRSLQKRIVKLRRCLQNLNAISLDWEPARMVHHPAHERLEHLSFRAVRNRPRAPRARVGLHVPDRHRRPGELHGRARRAPRATRQSPRNARPHRHSAHLRKLSPQSTLTTKPQHHPPSPEDFSVAPTRTRASPSSPTLSNLACEREAQANLGEILTNATTKISLKLQGCSSKCSW
jgi:hypothetical protein